MKLVNPVGREINTGMGTNSPTPTPRACMCGPSGGQFTGARGHSDGCLHCGCDCTGSKLGSGNSRNALSTIHRS